MTLEEGINLYVLRKQASGISFSKGRQTYTAFLKAVGNLSLSEIKVHHVWQFLNHSQVSTSTFRNKHSLLRRFFDYWATHGEIEWLAMPANRPAERAHFSPYIYTREELRRLFRLVLHCKTPNGKIHPKTIRAILVTLYATGSNLGEIARLVYKDVDLPNGLIKFSGNQLKCGRCIPIGKDLIRVLQKYADWQKRRGAHCESFFSTTDGKTVSPRRLHESFDFLRRTAGIAGHRGSSQKPCLRDLRATFAVHQITSWIRRKVDINLMLPALGAYMGNAGLEASERYLQLNPQRFQESLNKLSPQNSRTGWRGKPAQVEFLACL